MTADDLSAPLGQQTATRTRRRLPFTGTQALAAGLGLFLAGFTGFAIFHHDPLGGEPVAHIALKPATGEAAATAAPSKPGTAGGHAAAGSATAHPPAAGQKTITIIDGSSGARQNVVIGTTDRGTTDNGSSADGAAPATANGINPKLLEKSRYGLVPVAAGSLKPFTAYAAASGADRARAAAVPTVAIVVSGLGVDAGKTVDAIMKLPGPVTLALTPYGQAPGKLAERARARHHEVLLQVPMEPHDYPNNDPGPRTLLTTLNGDQNIDRLLWQLSRFQGYVGIASFMGDRFVASESSMRPIIADAARRGLGYFDDGLSGRSVAGVLAQSQAMPYGKADLAVDSVPTAAEIDRALATLEARARAHGNAIGVASGLPISIERITAWARTLDRRGIMLVPLTTAMTKPKSD